MSFLGSLGNAGSKVVNKLEANPTTVGLVGQGGGAAFQAAVVKSNNGGSGSAAADGGTGMTPAQMNMQLQQQSQQALRSVMQPQGGAGGQIFTG